MCRKFRSGGEEPFEVTLYELTKIVVHHFFELVKSPYFFLYTTNLVAYLLEWFRAVGTFVFYILRNRGESNTQGFTLTVSNCLILPMKTIPLVPY